MVEHSANRRNASSEEIKLNYIDKVSQAVSSTGKSLSRVMLFQYALSGLLLGVCAGFVSFDGDYSLLGISIEISLSAGLYLGGGILAVLTFTAVSLMVRQGVFLNELERLYQVLDYKVPWDEDRHPFSSNDAFDAVLAKHTGETPPGWLAATYNTVAVWLLIGSWTLLPVAAAIAVLIKLIWTAGWVVGGPAILLVLVTIGAAVELWQDTD